MDDVTADSGEDFGPQARITPRLIDSLYTEAMLLADEARAYFDEAGRGVIRACGPKSSPESEIESFIASPCATPAPGGKRPR